MTRRLLALVLLLLAACSNERGGAAPPNAAEKPFTYVAVGASESVGVGTPDPLRQAWTQVFHRTALPKGTTFVNMGISGATVTRALADEVPEAVALEPRLVTVWLNVNDLVRLVPVDRYERDLTTLVSKLRRGGRTDVLLANTPPIDRLPVIQACLPNPPAGRPCVAAVTLPSAQVVIDAVAQYNAAIARVAEREGAILVDLHAAGMRERAAGREAALVADDGFHPSVTGHEVIAAEFAKALRTAPETKALAGPS